MHLTTLLPTPLLLFQVALVTSRPTPSPQFAEIPVALQCGSGSPTCGSKGLILTCISGNLVCFGGMVSVTIGKCSECVGSICAKGPDAYPGDQRNTSCEATRARRGEPEPPLHVVVEREIMARQAHCTAGYECACVAFDGKGYYTRGVGGQCPLSQGMVSEQCTEDGGYLVSAWLRTGSDIYEWLTN